MTVEASTSFPEAFSSEPVSPETFNDLLYTTRYLHFGARTDEVYGTLKVSAHSDEHTYMKDGHPKLRQLELIIQDLPSEGVLIREIHSYPDPANDRVVAEKALLLNSFEEGPRLLRLPIAPMFAIADTDKMLGKIRANGEPLSESAAQEWLAGLNGLIDSRTNSQTQSERHFKTVGMVRRLLHKKPEKV